MTRADLIRQLMSTELEDHRNLTRKQARTAVNEVFGAIAEALTDGKVVRLPIGNFAVREHRIQPRRRWFLGRVRVTYRKRNYVEFQPNEEALESFDGESSRTRGARGATKQKKERAQNLTVSERRKLVRAGAKAGKSQRLIAQELGVSAPTVARDMGTLGIKTRKKPTATRKKKAATWKPKSPRISAKQSAENRQRKTVQISASLTKKLVKQKFRVPERTRPKPRTPTPEERRQEMVKAVQSWLREHKSDYLAPERVVDKGRKILSSRPKSMVKKPPPTLSATELRDQTRPAQMNTLRERGRFWTEEACAKWLAHWVSEWAPGDDGLQFGLLTLLRRGMAKPNRHYPEFHGAPGPF